MLALFAVFVVVDRIRFPSPSYVERAHVVDSRTNEHQPIAAVPPPRWTFSLPHAFDVTAFATNANEIAAGGDAGLIVVDAAGGHRRWTSSDAVTALAVWSTAVFVGTRTGTVVSRALVSGAPQWRTNVCPRATKDSVSVGALLLRASDLIAVCNDGTVARLRFATGSLLASTKSMSIDTVTSIESLGPCAYDVIGFSDGAMLAEHSALLDCETLASLTQQRDETWPLGTFGDVAVLDDECCRGRPDVYRPATIVRIGLESAAKRNVFPDIDLTPEPERYPAEHRPLGQNATTILVGARIFLSVDHTLYSYDLLDLAREPRKLETDLDRPMQRLSSDFAVTENRHGDDVSESVLDLNSPNLRVVWHGSIENAQFAARTIASHEAVLEVSSSADAFRTFIRLPGGAKTLVPTNCGNDFATNGTVVVTICTTKRLVDDLYEQYLAAYDLSSTLTAPISPSIPTRS